MFQKINYAALLNDDDDDDDDEEKKVGKDGTAHFSSDEEELLENNFSSNTENMFDSLKEDVSPEIEKPKQKRKLGPKIETNPSKRPKKKNSYSGSDDDFVSSKVRFISLSSK